MNMTMASAAAGVKLEELTEFADIPFILQLVATVIAIGVCLYEATYPGRVKKRDNKERFKEYTNRYKWN